jgi:hypothetical protein
VNRNLIIDTSYRDTVKQRIQFISDRYNSVFSTPTRIYLYANGVKIDSIIESEFRMSSWYHLRHDTIDMVAHIGDLESTALLLRFVNGQVTVLFFRAPHGEQRFFRANINDSFSSQIEIPPAYYKLILSEIPDTVNLPVIYGHIEMESGDYYDARDSGNLARRVFMDFYFRSQKKKVRR